MTPLNPRNPRYCPAGGIEDSEDSEASHGFAGAAICEYELVAMEHAGEVCSLGDRPGAVHASNQATKGRQAVSRRNEVTAKETRALQLRSQGRRLDEIAADLGYADASGAHRAINRALAKHQATGVEEYRAMSTAQLDELDAQAATIMGLPGVGASDLLRAIEARRKIVHSRGEVLGIKHAEKVHAAGAEFVAPDAGNGTLVLLSLDEAPTDVLPEGLEAVGVIPEGTLVIFMDPVCGLRPAGVGTFCREGRLVRGNVLLRCEPEELETFLRWKRERMEERWRVMGTELIGPVPKQVIEVDPKA
jgi:hypothetical protein